MVLLLLCLQTRVKKKKAVIATGFFGIRKMNSSESSEWRTAACGVSFINRQCICMTFKLQSPTEWIYSRTWDVARKIWKEKYYHKVRLQIIHAPPVSLNGISEIVDAEDTSKATVLELKILDILCHPSKIPVTRWLSTCWRRTANRNGSSRFHLPANIDITWSSLLPLHTNEGVDDDNRVCDALTELFRILLVLSLLLQDTELATIFITAKTNLEELEDEYGNLGHILYVWYAGCFSDVGDFETGIDCRHSGWR